MTEERSNYVLFFGCAIIFILLLVLLLGYSSTQAKGSRDPDPQNGVIDLTAWDFDKDGFIKLNGEWQFYWHKLLTWEELTDQSLKTDAMAYVPSIWNEHMVQGENLPGFGYATYHLKVKNAPLLKKLAFKITSMGTAYRLYVNDKLIAYNGVVTSDAKSFKPDYRYRTASFTPQEKDFDIIVQVANFTYARGGIWEPLYLGTSQQIKDLKRAGIFKNTFLLGALIIMALHYLIVYCFHQREKIFLFFIFLCIAMASRTLLFNGYILYWIFPYVKYALIILISYLTIYWGPVVFLLTIQELFPQETNGKLVTFFSVLAGIFTLCTVASPIRIYTKYIYLVESIVVITLCYCLWIITKAALQKKTDAHILLLGSLILFFAIVHDILYLNYYVDTGLGEMASFGFFLFLFFQSFVITSRFSHAENKNFLTVK